MIPMHDVSGQIYSLASTQASLIMQYDGYHRTAIYSWLINHLQGADMFPEYLIIHVQVPMVLHIDNS